MSSPVMIIFVFSFFSGDSPWVGPFKSSTGVLGVSNDFKLISLLDRFFGDTLDPF